MAYEAQFKRDSPPGSVQEEMDRIATEAAISRGKTYYQNEDDSCEERKDISMDKRVQPLRSFSSKLELDAGLESMFEMAEANSGASEDADPLAFENLLGKEDQDMEENEAELQLVRHLMEPLSPAHLGSPGVDSKSKTRKNGRRKRGASLERMIAKMILETSNLSQEAPVPTAVEEDSAMSVTTKDILSDLVKAGDAPSAFSGQSKETSAFSGQSKETTPWANTSQGAIPTLSSNESIPDEDFPRPTSLLPNESEKHIEEQQGSEIDRANDLATDEFGFDTGDDGWTAFDDCPPFDTSLFPSQDLDKNGFPMVNKESTSENKDVDTADADDEFEAEEEELAADLIKEMEEEVARDGEEDNHHQRKTESSRSRFVANQAAKIESHETEEIRNRLLMQREREEARIQEEEEKRLVEEAAFARQRAEENERLEQNMAKELARRIAKEQEWGKLHEMAQELARKQQEVENLQFRKMLTYSEDRAQHRRPFTFEEVDVSRRTDFEDDEVSSLPTTQSIDSRSLSQFISKENKIPPSDTKSQYNTSPPPAAFNTSDAPPPSSSPEAEKKEVQPKSPSSVVELNAKPTKNTPSNSGPMAMMATQRFRQARLVFSNRQDGSSSPTTRPKPTWNPKPPRHYNRTANGL